VEGFGKNMIAIIIIHYHKVIITIARGGYKSSSLVRVNVSGRLDSSNITVVGFGGRAGRVPIGCLVFGCALVMGNRAWGFNDWLRFWLGREQVFAGLVHVALRRGYGTWWIMAQAAE
jgi:hypothetical protein